jgi:hypothetical protein
VRARRPAPRRLAPDSRAAGDRLGAPNLRRLVAEIEALGRYDGVSARRPGDDPDDFDPGEPS